MPNPRRDVDATEILVEEAMAKAVHTVHPTDPAHKAGGMMLSYHYSALPVVEGRTLVGIITETDFMRHMVEVVVDTDSPWR